MTDLLCHMLHFWLYIAIHVICLLFASSLPVDRSAFDRVSKPQKAGPNVAKKQKGKGCTNP